jgi:hypothetical protein
MPPDRAWRIFLLTIGGGKCTVKRCLRGGETSDRHSVGRAGDVVEAHLLGKVDALGVAAVLAADVQLEIGIGLLPPFAGHPPEPANPVPVEVSKGCFWRMPSSRYWVKKPPSAASQLRPQKVWMRSLVPKEKKPTLPAISLATAQALDNSI